MTGPVAGVVPALPGLDELQAALGAEVLSRAPTTTASTFASEVIVVRRADGTTLPVYGKYTGGRANPGHGHRGGVAYEADVYERVLSRAATTTPALVGTRRTGDGEAWLFLEYLDGADRASRSRDAGAMALAGAWIGELQYRLEPWAAHDPDAAVLTRYDAAYYRGWIERTCEFVDPGRRPGWLGALAAQAGGLAERLSSIPRTVIHGEYTPANVLYRDGVVHVVDWESAALGAGEIDLAFLADGWRRELAGPVERAYRDARYPAGAPEDAGERLKLARLYLHTRWLGDRPSWTRHRKMRDRLDLLGGVVRGLGVA